MTIKSSLSMSPRYLQLAVGFIVAVALAPIAEHPADWLRIVEIASLVFIVLLTGWFIWLYNAFGKQGLPRALSTGNIIWWAVAFISGHIGLTTIVLSNLGDQGISSALPFALIGQIASLFFLMPSVSKMERELFNGTTP